MNLITDATTQIQNRIKELKEKGTEQPLPKICPVMSYRREWYTEVDCVEKRCALWNNLYECCEYKNKTWL
jgi:hypothetical protein